MANVSFQIAPEVKTYATWASENPTLGTTDSGDTFGGIVIATGSTSGNVLVYGANQSFNTAWSAGQYIPLDSSPTFAGVTILEGGLYVSRSNSSASTGAAFDNPIGDTEISITAKDDRSSTIVFGDQTAPRDGIFSYSNTAGSERFRFFVTGIERWRIQPEAILPHFNNSYDIGSTSLRVRTLYGYNINMSGTTTLAGKLTVSSGGVQAAGGYTPAVDNVDDLGTVSLRFDDVFATNATIQTSDEREKTEIRPLTESELSCAKELAQNQVAYKWRSAVDEKGEGARIHCGMIAQNVIEIFSKHGLDAMRYGIVTYDEWEAETKDAWTETKETPVTEKVEVQKTKVELVDGKYVEIVYTETEEKPATEPREIYNTHGELIRVEQVPVATTETVEHPEEIIREAGDRYGLRYSELFSFIIAGLA